jgi:hypothetical protein
MIENPASNNSPELISLFEIFSIIYSTPSGLYSPVKRYSLKVVIPSVEIPPAIAPRAAPTRPPKINPCPAQNRTAVVLVEALSAYLPSSGLFLR